MNKYVIKGNPLGYPTEEAMKVVQELLDNSKQLSNDQKHAIKACLDYVRTMY
jgi:aryl carrier-like protein